MTEFTTGGFCIECRRFCSAVWECSEWFEFSECLDIPELLDTPESTSSLDVSWAES